jgi:hypothetical protein
MEISRLKMKKLRTDSVLRQEIFQGVFFNADDPTIPNIDQGVLLFESTLLLLDALQVEFLS